MRDDKNSTRGGDEGGPGLTLFPCVSLRLCVSVMNELQMNTAIMQELTNVIAAAGFWLQLRYPEPAGPFACNASQLAGESESQDRKKGAMHPVCCTVTHFKLNPRGISHSNCCLG